MSAFDHRVRESLMDCQNGMNPQTMQNLTHHVLGALAILDARGLSQFQTSLGLQLMRAVRVQVVRSLAFVVLRSV